SSSNVNKRQKLAHDFLSSIDQTGEFLALFDDDDIDEVKQERLELVDLALLVKQDMTAKARDPFSHAISATFIQYHNATAENAAACGLEAQSDAIQPAHIREAIRRYSHKVGPLSPFTVCNNRAIKSYIYILREV
ncbi:UNVERIFIED_CONTAM: hypothetical protein FKN15_070286, partial [Acipenser sinensis]